MAGDSIEISVFLKFMQNIVSWVRSNSKELKINQVKKMNFLLND